MDNTTSVLPHVTLHFNIAHPSFEDCYVYGYECALAEITEEENPFQYGTPESEHWSEGWWAGFYGDKPIFELETTSQAANDQTYHDKHAAFFSTFWQIAGAIAVSAVVGYQVMDLVA